MTLAPLQLYVSALIFTPTDSLVRRTGSIPSWIQRPPVVEKSWGTLLQTLEHKYWINSVVFSPDDQLPVGTDGENIKIWDTATGVLKRELIHECSTKSYPYGDRLRCVDFSLDNRNLVSASDSGEILMWETKTWRPTQRLIHSGTEHTSFSPDSQMLASGSRDGTVNVWGKYTDAWKLKWKFHSIGSEFSFSSNSVLLAARMDRGIVIWSMKTGEIHHKIPLSTDIKSVKFSQDSQFLFASSNNAGILVWETKDWTQKPNVELTRPYHSSYNPYIIHVVSLGNKYIATSEGDSITIVEMKTWTMFQTARGHTRPVTSVTFSSDSQLMASGGLDDTLLLWEVVPGRPADNLDKHSSSTHAVLYFPDGSLVATGALNDKVKIWYAGTGSLERTIMHGKGDVDMELKFSPNNKILAWGNRDGSVMVQNLQTKKLIVQRGEVDSYDTKIREIQFSRSSQLVAATSRLATLEVWDTETGIMVKQEDQSIEGEELQNFR